MNKAELIRLIATEHDITRAAAEKVLSTITGAVTSTVARGESVSIVGFGSFRRVKRAARPGRNPQTGEKIKIAASMAPKFTPGVTFKAAVASAKGRK